MEVKTIYCDCCKEKIDTQGRWEFEPHPFAVSVQTDCQNPLGALDERPGHQYVYLKFDHICLMCAKGLANSIASFIQGKRNQK